MRKMREKGKKVESIYFCPECEGYHLSSMTTDEVVRQFK